MAQNDTPENEQSLSSLFESAKNNQEDLDTLDPRSDGFKALLQSTIDTLHKCSKLINQLALFSTNEDLDDISTSDIQYLGIDYLLSELNMRSYSSTDRKAQLNTASELLEDFLSRLDDYSLLNAPDKKLLESYKDDRAHFRIIGDAAGLEAKRNTKVKRFQDEKALKSQLKLLSEQTQSLNVDDEVIRKLYLAELNLHVHQSFQALDLISQERQILASIPSQPDPNRQDRPQSDSRDRRNNQTQPYSERLDPPSLLSSTRLHRGILDPAGRPLQPFTITSKRTDLRAGVFRPDHSLPTMSIDEYLEEERRRGGIIDGGGPASEMVVQPDEDDQVALDAATVKAREWDEYVEANPKGAGNTINRG